MQRIEATITVEISHLSGPEVADQDHVVAWTCADGAWMNGGRNGFEFEVCPKCPDPEECSCDGTVSIYHAAIVAASIED